MGLDSVELIIEVEQTFEIAIPDAEAGGLITVGQLYRAILKRLEGLESSTCLSAATFYRLRRTLMDSFGIHRERIRTDTPVEEILLRKDRRAVWRRLEQSLDLVLPPLERPEWLTSIFGASLLLMICLACVLPFTWVFPQGEAFGVATVILSFLLLGGSLAWRLTEPCARHLAPGCQTVRGLVIAISLKNYGRTTRREERWNRQEVWDTLRSLIVVQLGVRPEDVTESARFVEDFGVG